jgi:hypothetical protein
VGPDEIHYQILKHLPEESLVSLLEIFNNIWETGNFPSEDGFEGFDFSFSIYCTVNFCLLSDRGILFASTQRLAIGVVRKTPRHTRRPPF